MKQEPIPLDHAQSRRAKAGAATKALAMEALKKESPLLAKLRSRAMAGAKQAALRRDPTLLVKGVTNPTYREVHPGDFGTLELPDYQRAIQPDEVNELLRVLLAGGTIPDPITLSRRKWSAPENRPGRYYIVDGQQRVLAHMEAGKTIKAIVYDCESLDAERQLFVILNTRRAVNPNNIIAAANNKIASALRAENDDDEHPCFGRIMFLAQPGRSSRNLGASILLRGTAVAMGLPHTSRGLTAQKLMPSMDANFDAARVDGYLRLIAEATPPGDENKLRLLTALAIGKVYAEKFVQYGRVVMPSKASFASIRRVNWEKVTMGTWATRFLPIVLETIRERWKA